MKRTLKLGEQVPQNQDIDRTGQRTSKGHNPCCMKLMRGRDSGGKERAELHLQNSWRKDLACLDLEAISDTSVMLWLPPLVSKPQWDALQMQKVRFSLQRISCYWRFSLKPGAGQNIAVHVFAHCQEFWLCSSHSGQSLSRTTCSFQLGMWLSSFSAWDFTVVLTTVLFSEAGFKFFLLCTSLW